MSNGPDDRSSPPVANRLQLPAESVRSTTISLFMDGASPRPPPLFQLTRNQHLTHLWLTGCSCLQGRSSRPSSHSDPCRPTYSLPHPNRPVGYKTAVQPLRRLYRAHKGICCMIALTANTPYLRGKGERDDGAAAAYAAIAVASLYTCSYPFNRAAARLSHAQVRSSCCYPDCTGTIEGNTPGVLHSPQLPTYGTVQPGSLQHRCSVPR
jgi:hypothetical protein